MSIFDLPADHEARGIAKIVSEGRPQAVRTANRIARANNGGKNCNTGHASRAARIRRAEKCNGRREALDTILPTARPVAAARDRKRVKNLNAQALSR